MVKINTILSLFILSTLAFSCRKKDVIDNPLVTKAVKETTEHFIEKGSKTTAKSLLKEFSIDEKYLKNLNMLDDKQLDILKSDLIKHIGPKKFSEIFFKNPELSNAYRLVSDNPAIRTNTVYLENITKQLKANPNKKPVIELLNNHNKNMSGKVLNGVPFVKTTLKHNGFDITGVFADFSKHRLYTHILSKEQYLLKDAQQFNIAKTALAKEYKKNPEKIKTMLKELNQGQEYIFKGRLLKGDNMLDKQLADITNPKNRDIFGFTWHHNEKEGVMELVIQKFHDTKMGGVAHSGGRQIWGGGVR